MKFFLNYITCIFHISLPFNKFNITSAVGIVDRVDFHIGLKYRADKILYTHVSFTASLEFETDGYFVLDYKANGLRRFNHTRQTVISLLSGDQKKALAVCEDIMIDGEKHSLILNCDSGIQARR